jgi:hypothetical protein
MRASDDALCEWVQRGAASALSLPPPIISTVYNNDDLLARGATLAFTIVTTQQTHGTINYLS